MTSHPDTGPRRSGLTRLLTLSSLLWLGGLLTVSQAQLTLDGSLGPRGPVPGPHYRIGADVGQIRGGNLFHSFGEFNVPRGGSATFAGPNTIANIVSRVTGGQPSAIDGLLRSEIAGANLFLLNPSGVLFGPNASLDVRGSFHVSTADFLRFADGAMFSANLGQASVLTVAPPTAFGFLGPNPAAMTIEESVLEVPAGQTLSLVGGDITIVGGPLGVLRAAGGRIQLASVASPGEVGFSRLELAPDLQVDGFARLGRIELSNSAFLDASGNGGGSVLLRSGRLLVDRSFMFADTLHMDGASPGLDLGVVADAVVTNGSFIMTDSLGGGRAGDLRLTAGSVHVDNAVIGSRVFPLAFGDGGNVILNVRTLMLTGGAQIDSSTFGAGRGGDLSVEATEAVSIAGRGSGLFSITSGFWNAGTINVLAPIISIDEGRIQSIAERGSHGHAGIISVRGERLTLTGGAQIDSSTFGAGRGGPVFVTATDAIFIAGRDREGKPSGVFSNTFDRGAAGRLSISSPRVRVDEGARITAETFGDGPGGDIDIFMLEGQLTLTGGGRISSSTFGAGPGGSVRVTAVEVEKFPGSLVISGESSEGSPSGLLSTAFGSGNAGRVEISAPTLSIDGGVVISTGTLGAGRGGDVVVASRRLTLTGGAQISSSTDGAGPGGSIHVQTGSLELSHGGTITASSTGNGVAGTIQLQAGETFRSQNSAVTTTAARSGGGAITLHAERLVQLRNSALTTSVQGGGGDAGNLTLESPFVIAEGSQIVANAFAGIGGRIQITSDVFLADPASRVSASSELGISGTVDIRAPVTSLGGTLAPLPQAFVSAAALLPARCVARAQDGRYSSLVLGGREGLPVVPGSLLPSPLVPAERLAADPAVIGAPPPPSPATFTFLTGADKAFPRLGCPQ